MSRPAPSVLSLALAGGLVGGSALCGAMPQESKVQRPTPMPQAPAPTPRIRDNAASLPAPTPRAPRNTEDQTQWRGSGHPGTRTPRPTDRIRHYPGTRIIIPPAWERCRTLPGWTYWRDRDLMGEIKFLARSGFIPISPIGDAVDVLTDYSQQPAGWRAYGLAVPAGGTVQLEVQHAKLAWFRLMLVDKWGTPGPGMMQAAIAHQPVLVTYKNPNKEATAIYIIVDDPAWWSDAKDPYTLFVRRDWNPATTDLSKVKMVAGLWGASPSVSAEFRGPSLTGPAVYPH